MAQSNQVELLERLKASVRAQSTGLKSIEVPLYGGDPIKIYFRPMSMRDKGRILKLMERNVGEALVETFILRALDANGERMFSLGVKGELLNYPGMDRIIESACELMSEADREDKVEGTPDAGN